MTRKELPSVAVPLRFMVFGLLGLAVAAGWMVREPEMLLAHYQNARTVAWTHLFVLGFVLSIVMGALYQIVPVALETRLFSQPLAKFHSWLHIIGAPIMVVMFSIWDLKLVACAGGLVFVGMILLLINLFQTLSRAANSGVVATFVISSLTWMFAAMSAGMALAANAVWPFLPDRGGDWLAAHAHIGIVGIFVNLIIGLSLRLVPMFILSSIQSASRAWLSCILINGGMPGLYWAIACGPPSLAIAFGTVVAAGIFFGLWEIAAICTARLRRQFDWGLLMFFAALAVFIPTVAAGFAAALSPPDAPVRNVYAILALLGAVGFGIAGMLQKILPFLVWYAVYSPLTGRAPVPSLADLVSVRLQRVTLFAWLMGLALCAAGVLLRRQEIATAAAWFWAGAVTALLWNAALVLRHLVRIPSSRPLSFKFSRIP